MKSSSSSSSSSCSWMNMNMNMNMKCQYQHSFPLQIPKFKFPNSPAFATPNQLHLCCKSKTTYWKIKSINKDEETTPAAGAAPSPAISCTATAEEDEEELKRKRILRLTATGTGIVVGVMVILMGQEKAWALGPEGPLMEEFWENVRRYALYALTVSTGVLYAVLQPIVELLKNPISAILVILIIGGSLFIFSQILSAMFGVSDFAYQYAY